MQESGKDQVFILVSRQVQDWFATGLNIEVKLRFLAEFLPSSVVAVVAIVAVITVETSVTNSIN